MQRTKGIDMEEQAKSGLTYEPELTGLLIVDPYNDFLSEGGKLYELSRSTLEAHNVVEHMRQVLAAARAGGHATLIRGADKSQGAFAPLSDVLMRVHQQLKQAFDPARIFNPGRLYAGL